MGKAAKIIGTLVVIAIVAIVGLAIAATTVDINKYRPQLADALTKQTGRTVKLDGPIKLAISEHGVGLAAEDASIGNPAWASRPQMARIGKLELGVALAPLLQKQLVVNELNVDSADIQLETNASGQHNWEFTPAAGAPGSQAPQQAQPSAAPGGSPIGIRVNELSVADSKLVMRNKDGDVTIFTVDKLTLTPSHNGTTVALEGDYDGTPIKLDLKTGASDLMADAKWPYDAEASYAGYQFKAKGTIDRNAKAATLESYELSAGGSTVHGQLTANYGGAKPSIRGTLASDKLDPADFKPASSSGGKAAPEAAPATESKTGAKPLFSPAPLELSALKSADATLDVTIGELVAGKSALKQVDGKLVLANGELSISPFKAMLGESQLQGTVKLNAAVSPAQYAVTFKAPGVDLAGLLDMMGTKQFLTGKGDADIELSGAGSSLHEMAASTNGHIDITAQGGSINASAAGEVASGLAQILSPGASAPTLNCLATRFNVSNGVAKDNGILADSSASTVAGSGGFNLGSETVDLTLDAKPKTVNTRGLTPALKVSGPLGSPGFGIDTVGAAQNAASTFLKGKLGGLGNSLGGSSAEASVPTLLSAPQGQNACIYTLDHKGAAASAAPQQNGNNAVKSTSGSPTGNVKTMGNQLMKGLLGH